MITKSAADVGYWSDEWGVGGKSGAKIRLGSFCVRKTTGFDIFVRRVFGSCDR
ncbi:MAG: hypothetical protein HWQ38_28090 [Nostoc sp. NMS7]|uniref:hypothetical protein n=1 Tax=Nostoc sp. NMS7 TaxID=2815391 RepID=UPI0025F1B9D3|nr:hypothetical protein [Nostoc sp. NMS7]MBN3950123.1 hypothetical protein [Nostoc sp. NMS7]